MLNIQQLLKFFNLERKKVNFEVFHFDSCTKVETSGKVL